MRAVNDNFVRFLYNANGVKIGAWIKMKMMVGNAKFDSETAVTKAFRFSATNTVYADTKPICDIAIDDKIANLILLP